MNDPQKIAQAVARLAETVQSLDQRLQALEAKFSETSRQAEAVAGAQRSWRAVLEARGRLVLQDDAGRVASLPLELAEAIGGGLELTVAVEESGPDEVRFVGHDAKPHAVVPRALFGALPRVLETWRTSRSGRASASAKESRGGTGRGTRR